MSTKRLQSPLSARFFQKIPQTAAYSQSVAMLARQKQLKMKAEGEMLLAAMAHRICNSLNPMTIFQEVVAEVQSLLDVERVVIYRFEADWSGEVVAESVADHCDALMGRTFSAEAFDQDWVMPFLQGHIQSTADIYDGHLPSCQVELLRSLKIRANLVVPIVKYSKTALEQKDLSLADLSFAKHCHLWGVLSVQQCTYPRSWQPEEIALIEKLSIHVAIALQQAELYHSVRLSMLRHQRAEVELRRLVILMKQQVTQRMLQLEASNKALRDEIHKRDHLEERLFQEKELAQVTLKSIGDAVITTDIEGQVKSLNPVAENLTGWKSADAEGLSLSKIFRLIHEDTKEQMENPVCQVLLSGKILSFPQQSVLVNRDGQEYYVKNSVSPIFNRNHQIIGTVLVFQDVTQSHQAAQKLAWQANHDPLTGLVNRREFEKQITTAIDVVQNAAEQSYVLCYLDLDGFKTINDTCGHLSGDQLLKSITGLLQQRIRTSDTLARLGGDEFGLLLHHCSLDKAQQVAADLVQLIQTHEFIWEGVPYTVGVSIGLVSLDHTRKDLMTVLNAADMACYAAKKEGGNAVKIADPLSLKKSERYWIGQLHSALEQNRLRLFGQKIEALSQSSEFDMFEVLLRFLDEEGNLLLPEALILAAERLHQTRSLDQWVIQTFCESYHCQKHYNPLLYTINLSGESINNAPFTDFLTHQLQKNQVPPDRICFEITETLAIKNLKDASKLIHAVKKLGCRFALDDFGTGMSSLTYLKSLPVDFLKIDGAFVQQMASNPIDFAIVDCFNRLSHELGIQTIAEWVEDEPTLLKLKAMGVDYVQGFRIDKPSPLLLP